MKILPLFSVLIFLILFSNHSFADEITLPPDPGKAGNKTLLGIDSDNDGVRDDIQRYIHITYPNEEKVRLALFQISRNYQEILPNADDPEITHENVKLLYKSFGCLRYVLNNDTDRNIDIRRSLKAVILNTMLRSRTFIQSNESLAGRTTRITAIEERKNCCQFDVDNIE